MQLHQTILHFLAFHFSVLRSQYTFLALPSPCTLSSPLYSSFPLFLSLSLFLQTSRFFQWTVLSRAYAYIHVDMVIHRHRRWYVNKLDSSFVAEPRAGGERGPVSMGTWYRKRKNEPSWGRGTTKRTRKCKRLSSRTHDPDDRIQIYWPFGEQRGEKLARSVWTEARDFTILIPNQLATPFRLSAAW